MAAIVLDRVSKRFGATDVIRDLSLEIGSGEFLVLVGPSGCGKSTLLRMIAGLETASGGRILIDGRPIENLPPGERGVAMVFQNYALYPHMTVRENITFGLRNLGMPAREADARADQAATRLQIGHLMDRKPGQLSGGQRQRVAIGRAIVKQPKAFLFDEPLSNLDAALRSDTRVELARLHHALGATMVFVTHDQVEAMTMASRIVVMNQGRVEQIGSPVDVYRQPGSRFVAGFIGSPAMNFLPAEPTASARGTLDLRLSDGTVLATGLAAPRGPLPARLTVGLRAEDIRAQEAGPIVATVDVVERLGSRTLVYARMPQGSTLVYEEIGLSPVAIGQSVRLAPDPHAVHLFDHGGRRVAARQAEAVA